MILEAYLIARIRFGGYFHAFSHFILFVSNVLYCFFDRKQWDLVRVYIEINERVLKLRIYSSTTENFH